MESEIIETVLKEILDEIKMIHQENAGKEKYAEDLNNKIQSAEGKLQSIKQRLVVISESQLQLESATQRMEKIIKELPRNVIHKKQILLFPEYGPREYYRIVFGRIIFWIMMFLLAFFLFSLGKQFINSWKEIKEMQYNTYFQKNEL